MDLGRRKIVVGRSIQVQPEKGGLVRRFIKTCGGGVEGDEVYPADEAAELALRLLKCSSNMAPIPAAIADELQDLLNRRDA